jgi:hypothetical protein
MDSKGRKPIGSAGAEGCEAVTMTDPTATNHALGVSGEGAVQPGTILAVIARALASAGFSFYLSNSANYAVIYGSLGTAIALLLYLSKVAVG